MVLCFSRLKEIACNDTCDSWVFSMPFACELLEKGLSQVSDSSMLENIRSIVFSFFFCIISFFFQIAIQFDLIRIYGSGVIFNDKRIKG